MEEAWTGRSDAEQPTTVTEDGGRAASCLALTHPRRSRAGAAFVLFSLRFFQNRDGKLRREGESGVAAPGSQHFSACPTSQQEQPLGSTGHVLFLHTVLMLMW